MSSNTLSLSRNLLADVSNLIIQYLKPLNIDFCFGGEKVTLHEGLHPELGGLLFLYDKQVVINNIIKKINSEDISKAFYCELYLKEQENATYFGFSSHIEHNLIELDNKKFNYHDIKSNFINFHNYNRVVFALIESILRSPYLTVQDNMIHLDILYEKMRSDINNHKIQIIENHEQINFKKIKMVEEFLQGKMIKSNPDDVRNAMIEYFQNMDNSSDTKK